MVFEDEQGRTTSEWRTNGIITDRILDIHNVVVAQLEPPLDVRDYRIKDDLDQDPGMASSCFIICCMHNPRLRHRNLTWLYFDIHFYIHNYGGNCVWMITL